MEDKTSRSSRPARLVLGAILIFLMGGAIAELPAEEATAPPPPEVSEARRYYDSVTWHDVVFSGPNRIGYSIVVIHEMPAQHKNNNPNIGKFYLQTVKYMGRAQSL